MTPADSVRVMVLAEDPLARMALLARLGGPERAPADLLVAAESATVDEAQPLLFADVVDVVLWDLGLHVAAGLPELQERDARWPPLLVLVPDDKAAADARRHAVPGILGRAAAGHVLAAGLRAVAHGLTVREPRFDLQPPPTVEPPTAPTAENLTVRERSVLLLLVEGLSNKRIADRLGMSEHTAKFHVNAILQKLGVATRTEAVVRAARLGLVTL